MREANWIYYDIQEDQFVLVKRPHRKAVNGLYEVRVYVQIYDLPRRWEATPYCLRDVILIGGQYFRDRYLYVCGLNTFGRPGKRVNAKTAFIPGRGEVELRAP